MTKERACANKEELRTLPEHLQDCQDLATHLSGLIESAQVIYLEGPSTASITSILTVSGHMSDKLASMLDSVNLPEARA